MAIDDRAADVASEALGRLLQRVPPSDLVDLVATCISLVESAVRDVPRSSVWTGDVDTIDARLRALGVRFPGEADALRAERDEALQALDVETDGKHRLFTGGA